MIARRRKDMTWFPDPLCEQKYGGMEVPEVKRLKSLEEENARLRKLPACLPKPCWTGRHFRWLRGESTDDRPEAGSR